METEAGYYWRKGVAYGVNLIDNQLYRCYKDGSNPENLLNEPVQEAKISGEWIYYINLDNSAPFRIWKARLDGSDKTLLTGDYYTNDITVLDDWIYFINTSYGTRKLYRVRIDGSNLTLLSENEIETYKIYNGCIYSNSSLEQTGYIYKMNLDGSNKVKLDEGETNISKFMVGDWIYYTKSMNDNEGIYKIKADGSSCTKLGSRSDKNWHYSIAAIKDDWIYYSNRYSVINDSSKNKNELYKIKTDGTNKTNLNINDFENYYGRSIISGDWMYYTNFKDSYCLYGVKLDGTGETKLSDEKVNWFTVDKDRIYYWDSNNNKNGIFSANLDGTDKIKKQFDYVLQYIQK